MQPKSKMAITVILNVIERTKMFTKCLYPEANFYAMWIWRMFIRLGQLS